MTDIQIELDDETLGRLALLAKAKGLPIEEYDLQALREHFRKSVESAASSDEMPS